MTLQPIIRPIQPSDNNQIFSVFRAVFEEHGIIKQGTAYFDECLPFLYETYTTPFSGYFIVEWKGKIMGGAGIFPTDGLPNDTVELVKMYLLNEVRNKGIGQMLMNTCLEKAQELHYKKVYLETLSEFEPAIHLYKKNSFTFLDKPMGNSGHDSCSIQMIKEL
jgi:putative acetyltransferase